MLGLGLLSCAERGKVGLLGRRGVLLGLGTSELGLGHWNGYVIGRVWPTGLGTLPLRKPAVSLQSPLKVFFLFLFFLKFLTSQFSASNNVGFSLLWPLKLSLPAATCCCGAG